MEIPCPRISVLRNWTGKERLFALSNEMHKIKEIRNQAALTKNNTKLFEIYWWKKWSLANDDRGRWMALIVSVQVLLASIRAYIKNLGNFSNRISRERVFVELYDGSRIFYESSHPLYSGNIVRDKKEIFVA